MIFPNQVLESVTNNANQEKFSFDKEIEFSKLDEKTIHEVSAGKKTEIDRGQLMKEMISRGLNSINPDVLFERIVENYEFAEQLFGKKLLRLVSGYESNELKQNLNFPEFKKDLKDNIKRISKELKNENYIDKENVITEKGQELAALILYTEELDKLKAMGFGNRITKKSSHYGDKEDTIEFKKQRYKDIAVRKSISRAIRRGHNNVDKADLKAFERKRTGKLNIVYCVDSSGSMKGDKIDIAKKAGIALSFKAIENKDKIGLIIFGKKIKSKVLPTLDFGELLKNISKASAAEDTDFLIAINEASKMLNEKGDKHVIMITDAMNTVGEEKEIIQLASALRAKQITVSIIGINLSKKAEQFALDLVQVSGGRVYNANKLEEIDGIILEDYAAL